MRLALDLFDTLCWLGWVALRSVVCNRAHPPLRTTATVRDSTGRVVARVRDGVRIAPCPDAADRRAMDEAHLEAFGLRRHP